MDKELTRIFATPHIYNHRTKVLHYQMWENGLKIPVDVGKLVGTQYIVIATQRMPQRHFDLCLID